MVICRLESCLLAVAARTPHTFICAPMVLHRRTPVCLKLKTNLRGIFSLLSPPVSPLLAKEHYCTRTVTAGTNPPTDPPGNLQCAQFQRCAISSPALLEGVSHLLQRLPPRKMGSPHSIQTHEFIDGVGDNLRRAACATGESVGTMRLFPHIAQA